MRRLALPIGLLVIALGALLVLRPSDKPSSPPHQAPQAKDSPPTPPRPSTRQDRPRSSPSPSQPTTPADKDAILATIEDATLTYQPSAVRTIYPFLTHPDASIREAALDALTNLGEPDAIPFLRKAASELSNPEEAAACHKIADYLALPSWSESEEGRKTMESLRQSPPESP